MPARTALRVVGEFGDCGEFCGFGELADFGEFGEVIGVVSLGGGTSGGGTSGGGRTGAYAAVRWRNRTR
ncbi:hypothetical protein ACWCOZ_15125 [Streptomyces sp. NPDC001840]